MKALLRFLVISSLGLNAFLTWHFLHERVFPNKLSRNAVSNARWASPADASRTVALLLADENVALSHLVSIKDALRAAGIGDSVIRGVIEGMLQQRFRERISPGRIERTRTTWWRSTMLAMPGPPAPDEAEIKLLREMVLNPLEKLFGPDALTIAESESRYDFLSADKAIRLAAIDLDYDEMRMRLMQSRPGDSRLKAELDQLRLLNVEKQTDVLVILSPEERAEYDLRFGVNGYDVRVRLEPLEGTEQEYRAAYPILKAFNDEASALTRSGADQFLKDDITRRAMQDLMAALGAERGLDFIWASSTDFAAYARVAREAGLPLDAAGRAQELAAETGVRAWEIHSDTTLSIEQKRDALLALQQQTQPQLESVLPAAARQKLSDQTLAWFTQLGAGSYKLFPITLSGRNGGASYSLTMPARATPPLLPVIPTPGK